MRTRTPFLLAALIGAAVAVPAAARPTQPERAQAFRLAKVVDGLRSPVYVTSAPGDKRLFVVEQEGTIRTIVNGRGLGQGVCRRALVRHGRRRAGSALGRLPSEVRDERQALHLFHEQAEHGGDLGAARGQGRCERAARPPQAALDPGSRGQPQRRPAGVRARQDAVFRRRRRRRRWRRARPARQRAGPLQPARQAGAHRRGHAHGRQAVRHSQGQSLRRQVRLARPRSGRSGCATRGASPSTAPTATSGSATSARTHGRRSTTSSGASPV